MCVAGESRTGQTVLLESPEPRQSVVLRNFTCLLLSELDSLCKWLHGKAVKGEALWQLPPQQLTHRGKAETAVADFTSHPPLSKPSYLKGTLKFKSIEAKPRQHDLGLGGKTR